MSEIPFVNRLGDALESAIAAQRAPRRRWTPRRRLLVIAVAIAAAIAASLAVARILSSPTKLAATGISCFDGNLAHGEGYLNAGNRTPVEACAHEIRQAGWHVPPLVACDSGGAVAVIPGSGSEACNRAGFVPLPRGYSAAHARVIALSRAIRSIEASSDCIPPRRLAARVQALLRRSRWEGWRVRLPGSRAGCGAVSEPIGDGSREISSSLDADARTVDVHGGNAHRSTETLLWGRHGLSAPLMDMSGKRCYTQSALRREVRRRLARTHRHLAFTVSTPSPNSEFNDARQARLEAGCAIVDGARPAADGLGIVIGLEQRR